jgi:hypothetical protein
MVFRVLCCLLLIWFLAGCEPKREDLPAKELDALVPEVELPEGARRERIPIVELPKESPEQAKLPAGSVPPDAEPVRFPDEASTRYSEYATPEGRDLERNPYGRVVPRSSEGTDRDPVTGGVRRDRSTDSGLTDTGLTDTGLGETGLTDTGLGY